MRVGRANAVFVSLLALASCTDVKKTTDEPAGGSDSEARPTADGGEEPSDDSNPSPDPALDAGNGTQPRVGTPGPTSPSYPVTPGAPVTPGTPVMPGAPVTPAAPVAPSETDASVGPGPTETSDQTSEGSDGGNPTFSARECASCIEEACADSLSACANDASCASFWACMNDCPLNAEGGPTDGCQARCAADNPGDSRKDILACWGAGNGAACPCGDPSDPDNPTGNADFSQECAASNEDMPCWACEDEKCCDSYAACTADQACLDYVACLKDCSATEWSAACAAECMELHADGLDTAAPRMACLELHCWTTDACLTEEPDDCESCWRQNCASTYINCAADPECYQLDNCMLSCVEGDEPFADCAAACKSSYSPEVVAAFDDFFVCAEILCPIECIEI